MRTSMLLASTLLFGACATGSGSGSVAPFQGEEAVKKRITEIEKSGNPVVPCLQKAAKTDHGYFEATADANGKVTVRQLEWTGDPAIGKCVVDTGSRITITPLPGPPVSALWDLRAKDAPPPPPPGDVSTLETKFQSVHGELSTNDVPACATRNLPPEFPADIALSLVIMPDGKPAVVNVIGSSSKDGNFDMCVQQAIQSKTFPATGFAGPFPFKLAFHVGGSYKI